MVEQAARFEEVKIPLREPMHGLDAVSGVLGVPEWWPTGSRVCLLLAQGSTSDGEMLDGLTRELTERKYLTLRFNLPFVEANKKRVDPPAVLRRTFMAAASLVGRDPTAAPAHIFIGGKNRGALAAAHAASGRLRLAGLVFLGYPLHKPGDPSEVRAERLFRAISPMLFIQGDRDRSCDLATLKQTLLRVGAPWDLHVVREADHAFKVLKKSERTEEDVRQEILGKLDGWMTKVLGE